MQSRVAMNRDNRLRRAALLCCHFTRNLAYDRAILANRPLVPRDFWITVAGSCFDVAILEWHKLFCNASDSHHWLKIIGPEFKTKAMLTLGISEGKWDEAVGDVTRYRNAFVAHLLSKETMVIPHLRIHQLMVEVYYLRLAELFSSLAASAGLPAEMGNYYVASYTEAEAVCKHNL